MTPDEHEDLTHELNHELARDETRMINRRAEWIRQQREQNGEQ